MLTVTKWIYAVLGLVCAAIALISFGSMTGSIFAPVACVMFLAFFVSLVMEGY